MLSLHPSVAFLQEAMGLGGMRPHALQEPVGARAGRGRGLGTAALHDRTVVVEQLRNS